MAKLFCIFTVLALVFLLIIEFFGLRGTTNPIGYLVVLGFVISSIGSASALVAHIVASKKG
jgi:hypothetical protein